MDDAAFWCLIDATRAADDDQDDFAEELRRRLRAVERNDVRDFARRFDALANEAYRWDLWAAAYAINGGCSDDCFEYFRNWLITRGEPVYRAALADPDSLATVVEPDDDVLWEAVGYVGADVYQELAGEELPYERASEEPAGERWEEEDLERIVPRIVERYWS